MKKVDPFLILFITWMLIPLHLDSYSDTINLEQTRYFNSHGPKTPPTSYAEYDFLSDFNQLSTFSKVIMDKEETFYFAATQNPIQNIVYIGAYSVPLKKELWRISMNRYIGETNLILYKNWLLVGFVSSPVLNPEDKFKEEYCDLLALDRRTGTILWKSPYGSNQLYLDKGILYTRDNHHLLLCYDLEKLKIIDQRYFPSTDLKVIEWKIFKNYLLGQFATNDKWFLIGCKNSDKEILWGLILEKPLIRVGDDLELQQLYGPIFSKNEILRKAIYGYIGYSDQSRFIYLLTNGGRGGNKATSTTEISKLLFPQENKREKDPKNISFIQRSPSLSELNRIYAIDPSSGKIAWETSTKGENTGLIIAPDRTLFLSSCFGELIKYEGDTGKVLWQQEYNRTEKNVYREMVISYSSNLLYAIIELNNQEQQEERQKTGLSTQELWALSPENGNILWKVKLPKTCRSWYGPVIWNGKIYLWNNVKILELKENS